MITDVTGAFTGSTNGLIISSADVRGEIVFYLRHKADILYADAKQIGPNKAKQAAYDAAAALLEAANEIEAAKIL